MPANLKLAVPYHNMVFPKFLCTSFTMTREIPVLSTLSSAPNGYHDGRQDRSLITDWEDGAPKNAPHPIRKYQLAHRLSAFLRPPDFPVFSPLDTLKNFYNAVMADFLNPGNPEAGYNAFWYYDPFDVIAGEQIGSNYDPTGMNPEGRVLVVFQGNWSQQVTLGRTNTSPFQLVEVA